MDYLTARWFLVKNISRAKLESLHSIETASYKYSLKCAKLYKKEKIVPQLWWQSGVRLIGNDYVDFWRHCEDKDNLTQVHDFAMIIRSVLTSRGVNVADIFNDISLMHECDLLIRTLPFTYQITSLQPYVPSSKVALA
ncbi:hypothetical protein AAIR98_000954 [Elusimicrobium simillimum]|uniref:hypothetical protein n=1 Tax=Elusimicrobium simillimum TaxID=3143438 RepID=UPI003C6EFC38